ncbi:F-box/FBD/LRR-repeat protein At5g22660-like [Aegilops tauschii subsp. strangulata]
MAGGCVDRLSSLPNDLLRRILHFAPLKEAASTTALSRRWREPLWLSSGAVNLETGVVEKKKHRRQQGHEQDNAHARFFSGSDDMVSAATGALDAATVPVTRLTLITWYPVSDHYEVVSSYKDMVEVVLSNRATRRVEELLLAAKDPSGSPYDRWVFNCTVTLDSLQLVALRILELTNCSGVLVYHTEAVLPRLSSLRLSHCTQQLGSLQRVIDAVPSLAAVRLEYVFITHEEAIEATWRHFRCPATTVLVLDSCKWEVTIGHRHGWFFKKTVDRLKIDAMRLRRFSYKGPLRSYSFSPQPLEFEQVDLEFFEQGYRVKDPNRDLETFWKFTRNFTGTKEMRLSVNHLEDIAVLSEARQIELLPAFGRLERLEFQGAHWTKDKTAAVTTILNLLHCCPVLITLRINLTAMYEEEDASNKQGGHKQKGTTRKEILMAAMVGPRYLFQCLQSSLRRVDLQFQLEKKDCLGVKLIKTFAENAMFLKEILIDSGDEKLCEHMKPRIAKWNSSRKELGATSFVLLPLKR